MLYADDGEAKSGMDSSHYAGLIVVLAILSLVGIRYWFEG